ncbi:general stress protein [Caldanaerobius polysaccharolyticus]|uniref:general stress protein n=1 Tax=Caldanaerobius polysaccharolyticus TaxID=44256 RepID=UPI00047EFCDB|nr:general stress protein [Caldanaerobius polysaccharolyticus]
MSKVIGVFNSKEQAEKAISSMREKGFKDNEISIVSKRENVQDNGGEAGFDSIADGTTTGGVIGGIAGLLASAGAMAIPGVGPIVAMGPIAALLTGAVGGGIAGGLIDMGIPAAESRRYEEEVKKGGILVIAQSDDNKVNDAANIMRANGAYDVKAE